MRIYVMLYAIIFVVYYMSTVIHQDAKKTNKIMAWTIFVLVTSLLALRHPSMGADLAYGKDHGYLLDFTRLSRYSWIEILEMESYRNYNKGYIIFNKLLGLISNDQQFLLIGCAFLSLWPVAYRLAQTKEEESLFSWLIYLGLPCFLLNFSGLRQTLAIGLVFFAFKYIEKKRFWKFCLCICLASTLHSSAAVCLIVYPVYHIKMQRNVRLLSVAAFPVIYVFRYQIFSILIRVMGRDVELDNNGAVNLLLLFILIYSACSLLWAKDDRYNGYLNIFFLACACQCMGGLYSIVLRMGYYFMMSLPILLPIVAKNFKYKRDEYIFKFGVGVGFTLFALMSISSSSWAIANPYYFFWE